MSIHAKSHGTPGDGNSSRGRTGPVECQPDSVGPRSLAAWRGRNWMSRSKDRTRIVVHHVGGRGFGMSFTYPAAFDQDVVQVLYEADVQCANEMIKQNDQPNRHILPYCLGREHSRGRLYIT